MTPARLEPATPGSVCRCLIRWATGPLVYGTIAMAWRLYVFNVAIAKHPSSESAPLEPSTLLFK